MGRYRWIATGIAVVGLAGVKQQTFAAGQPAPQLCASTPAAALLAARHATDAAPGSEGTQGYRVVTMRWDPLMQQRWAVIEACGHPERPSLMVLMDLPGPHPASLLASARLEMAMPIVRAGDLVRLWKDDGHAHIEMVATSEENGATGSHVRVRLTMPADLDGQATAPQYLAGVVRGPADVEMEP